MSSIPLTANRTVEFTPKALEQCDPKPVFHLKIPTWEDRDMMGIRLFRMNVREVTPQQMQAMLLSEMFEIKPEEQADADARFLESFWQRQAMYQMDLSMWQEQEAERIIDERESNEKFEPRPMPPERTTIRERARASMLTTEVQDNSQRMRDKLADQQGYQKRYAVLLVRIQVAGWFGLDTKATIQEDVLTPETIEALRSELMELDQTGSAWDQLIREIEGFWDLSKSAEKNSSSPPESGSPPNGSTRKISGSDGTDGSSRSTETTGPAAPSSIAPTPNRASRRARGTSSGSSKGSDTAKKKPGRTGGK